MRGQRGSVKVKPVVGHGRLGWRRRLARLIGLTAVTLISGCGYYATYEGLEAGAQHSVADVMRSVHADQDVRIKKPYVPNAEPDFQPGISDERKSDEASLEKLTLTQTLAIATKFNREFASQRDSNISAALSRISARHIFDPRLGGVLAYFNNWSKDTGSDFETLSHTANSSLTMDYLSVYGTSIHADVSVSQSNPFLGGKSATHTASGRFSLSQPLLRGRGRLINREPLTSAERSLVYRLRDFEIFRQRFSIQATRLFYDLVRQRQVIDNTERRYKRADFLYRRAQALFKIQRVPEIDVFQAEQEHLQSENNLRDTKEAFRDGLLRFKTFIGLSDDIKIGIESDAFPEIIPFDVTEEEATVAALANRLDLATSKARVEDAKRGLKIVRNRLLPQVDLVGSVGTSAASGSSFRSQTFDRFNGRVGIQVSVPFDRVSEQIQAKQAYLSLDQVKRGYTLFRDNLLASVRSTLRNLTRTEQSIDIQKKILVAAEKRQKVAEIRFRQGTRPSRDVVEAQEDLLEAQNTYAGFIVDHAVAVLELKREMGILRIDVNGQPMVIEAKATTKLE